MEFLIEENGIPMCGDTVYMTFNYKNVQGIRGHLHRTNIQSFSFTNHNFGEGESLL